MRLAQLVATRLCHDLSGVVLTLMGAVELGLAVPPDPEAAAMASEAATELGRRLSLLRTAWGAAGEPMTLDQLARLANPMRDGRVRLEVAGPAGVVLAPQAAQLVLNLILLGADSLPRGGDIRLQPEPDGLLMFIVGPRADWPPGLAAMLADPRGAWDGIDAPDGAGPRGLMGPLVAHLAERAGARLSLLLGGSGAPPLRLVLGHP